jgi:hypothetical protein
MRRSRRPRKPLRATGSKRNLLVPRNQGRSMLTEWTSMMGTALTTMIVKRMRKMTVIGERRDVYNQFSVGETALSK